MTEKEFKNLKVGDVVSYKSEVLLKLDKQLNIEDGWYNVDDIKWTWISPDNNSVTHLTYICQHYCSAYETLPLYRSPLYLAMQEGESDD